MSAGRRPCAGGTSSGRVAGPLLPPCAAVRRRAQLLGTAADPVLGRLVYSSAAGQHALALHLDQNGFFKPMRITVTAAPPSGVLHSHHSPVDLYSARRRLVRSATRVSARFEHSRVTTNHAPGAPGVRQGVPPRARPVVRIATRPPGGRRKRYPPGVRSRSPDPFGSRRWRAPRGPRFRPRRLGRRAAPEAVAARPGEAFRPAPVRAP